MSTSIAKTFLWGLGTAMFGYGLDKSGILENYPTAPYVIMALGIALIITAVIMWWREKVVVLRTEASTTEGKVISESTADGEWATITSENKEGEIAKQTVKGPGFLYEKDIAKTQSEPDHPT